MTSSKNNAVAVVVNPRFAIEWRDIDDFLGEFGPYNGRYVARYPQAWLVELKSQLDEISTEELSPIERHRLKQKISREINLCTTPVNWSWEAGRSWEANVDATAVLSEESIVIGNGLDPHPYSSWPQSVHRIKATRRRSWAFHGMIKEYLDSSRPLILNSPAAYLVDGYLDPFSQDSENLLLSMFEMIKGSRCYSVELITRQSSCGNRDKLDKKSWMTNDEIEASLRKIYESRVPLDRSLRLHLVEEDRSQDGFRMHDRFLLTRYGAINFGHGFLVLNQRQPQMNAHVVDHEHHKILKNTYIDGVSRHEEEIPRILGVAYPMSVQTLEVSR